MPVEIDLRTWGGPWVMIEPRPCRIAGKAIDMQTGDVLDSGELKTLLHRIAAGMPRMASLRSI